MTRKNLGWDYFEVQSLEMCVLFLYLLPHLNAFSYQAYKAIFTSPSSVEKESKATRSGNARIHGMTQVTPASLAYVATQVRLSLFFNHHHGLTFPP